MFTDAGREAFFQRSILPSRAAHTSEDNLIDELYTPCLKWAERFDRGVGYFTTGWLTYNVAGLSDFASRGGKMRLITSPILSTEDTDIIIGAESQDKSAFQRLEAALLDTVETLQRDGS